MTNVSTEQNGERNLRHKNYHYFVDRQTDKQTVWLQYAPQDVCFVGVYTAGDLVKKLSSLYQIRINIHQPFSKIF